MCRPTYYTVAYEINPWMRITRKPNHALARRQWNALHRILTQQLGIHVRLLPPRPGVPDLVFTANAGLAVKKTLIRSNFRHSERQREESIIDRYFNRQGWQIITLPRRHNFEGEGDALWFRETLVLGFRFRSDARIHERLSKLLNARVLPVELADKRFYHLDTCFAPLTNRAALWFPGAFDRYGQKVIENLVPDLISVSESDARRFVCNAIVVPASARYAIVLQEGFSATLRRKLTQRRFKLYPVDLSEFLKAGGSAKCLALRLSVSDTFPFTKSV